MYVEEEKNASDTWLCSVADKANGIILVLFVLQHIYNVHAYTVVKCIYFNFSIFVRYFIRTIFAQHSHAMKHTLLSDFQAHFKSTHTLVCCVFSFFHCYSIALHDVLVHTISSIFMNWKDWGRRRRRRTQPHRQHRNIHQRVLIRVCSNVSTYIVCVHISYVARTLHWTPDYSSREFICCKNSMEWRKIKWKIIQNLPNISSLTTSSPTICRVLLLAANERASERFCWTPPKIVYFAHCFLFLWSKFNSARELHKNIPYLNWRHVFSIKIYCSSHL